MYNKIVDKFTLVAAKPARSIGCAVRIQEVAGTILGPATYSYLSLRYGHEILSLPLIQVGLSVTGD